MANCQDTLAMYHQLTEEWSKTPVNLDKCGELLISLKLALTKLSYVDARDAASAQQEILIARSVLEIGARWAIAKKDLATFERHIAQLKTYYSDYSDLPESEHKYQLLGLNLLCLLAQNKLSIFHCELELLPASELTQNIFIKHPITIEQYLMEGRYNKIFEARANVPDASYTFFMEMLVNTIRDDIASCMEKSYKQMSVSAATKMMFFESEDDMKSYAADRGWDLDDGSFHFPINEQKDEEVPATEIAKNLLVYARELEMII